MLRSTLFNDYTIYDISKHIKHPKRCASRCLMGRLNVQSSDLLGQALG